MASIRARYFSLIERAVYLPDDSPAWRSAMVISSSSKGGTSGAGAVAARVRAPDSAGSNAVLMPPRTLLCKKLLRGGELGRSCFILVICFVFPMSMKKKRNYRLIASKCEQSFPYPAKHVQYSTAMILLYLT